MLRDGRADASVQFAEDERDGAFHLAARHAPGSEIVAVASFFPSPTPHRPGVAAWQLRGMAVAPEGQGCGTGRLVLETAVGRLRADDVPVLWANVRDTAIGFYRRLGWEIVGEGFINEIGLPHHVAVLDL